MLFKSIYRSFLTLVFFPRFIVWDPLITCLWLFRNLRITSSKIQRWAVGAWQLTQSPFPKSLFSLVYYLPVGSSAIGSFTMVRTRQEHCTYQIRDHNKLSIKIQKSLDSPSQKLLLKVSVFKKSEIIGGKVDFD